jgi:hypothetical protein
MGRMERLGNLNGGWSSMEGTNKEAGKELPLPFVHDRALDRPAAQLRVRAF